MKVRKGKTTRPTQVQRDRTKYRRESIWRKAYEAEKREKQWGAR